MGLARNVAAALALTVASQASAFAPQPMQPATPPVPLVTLAPGPEWIRAAQPEVAIRLEAAENPDHPYLAIRVRPKDPAARHSVERAANSRDEGWTQIALLAPGVYDATDRRVESPNVYYYRVVAVRGSIRSSACEPMECDMKRILDAIAESPNPTGVPLRRPRREPDGPSDADGTALLLVGLMVWSAFGKKRRT